MPIATSFVQVLRRPIESNQCSSVVFHTFDLSYDAFHERVCELNGFKAASDRSDRCFQLGRIWAQGRRILQASLRAISK
jgi:hypothetical protein